MSECLGCARCEDGPMVTLVGGRQVCSSCPEWLIECEARNLLRMPLPARRKALAKREEIRGKPAVDVLCSVMTALHGARKKA